MVARLAMGASDAALTWAVFLWHDRTFLGGDRGGLDPVPTLTTGSGVPNIHHPVPSTTGSVVAFTRLQGKLVNGGFPDALSCPLPPGETEYAYRP